MSTPGDHENAASCTAYPLPPSPSNDAAHCRTQADRMHRGRVTFLLDFPRSPATLIAVRSTYQPSYHMKTLDTRDLAERLDELKGLRDALDTAQAAVDEDNSPDNRTALEAAGNAFTQDEEDELQELEALAAEIGSEWEDGVTLIPERDFEDYAREFAEDIHDNAVRDASWPFDCIDWSAAADSLRMDYSSTTYQGTDYLYRA